MSAARRPISLVLVSLCALAALLALGASRGWAAVRHEYLSQFGEVPTTGPHGEAVPVPGPFSLEHSNALTVDAGKLYDAEGGLGGRPSRIDQFDTGTNAFLGQLPQTPAAEGLELLDQGIAVGHAGGEARVYVGADRLTEGTHGAVAVFDAAGALQSVWTGKKASSANEPFGCFECDGKGDVAVDNSGVGWAAGDVYVADPLHGVVDVFAPETGGGEEPVAQLQGVSPSEPFTKPVAVAVTETGEVIVADQSPPASNTVENPSILDVFKPSAIVGQYEFAGALTPPGAVAIGHVTSIAAGDGEGNIYISAQVGEEGQSHSTNEIVEFGAVGEFEGRIGASSVPGGTFGPGLPNPDQSVPYAVAADPATHRVYVGTINKYLQKPDPVFVFGPALVIPDVATAAASEVQATSVTLNGTVDALNAGPATCWFEWGTTAALGEKARCPHPVEGGGSVPVSASVTGLEPDTTYHYRLQAANANGTNEGEAWQDGEFKTTGPGVGAEWAAEPSSTAVTLKATLDPDHAPTSFYFQYGRSSGYEAQAPLVPVSIGSGSEAVTVAQHVQGLEENTVYHYRVVAVSELEVQPGVLRPVAFAGPDRQFTSQRAGRELALPDGRQWELVSPREKRGGEIAGLQEPSYLAQASGAGGAITYFITTPPEGPAMGNPGYGSQLLSARGADGWHTQDLALEQAHMTGLGGPTYPLFADDLSLGLVVPYEELGEARSLAPEASPPDTEPTPYLRHDLTCEAEPASCFEPLVTAAPGFDDVPQGSSEFGRHAEVVGASPNLAHVALAYNDRHIPGQRLYEWSAEGPRASAVRPVSVLPAAEGGTLVPASLDRLEANRHAISADGSRVVWTAYPDKGLYLRAMSGGEGETVRLDAVQGGSGAGAALPHFQFASADGSKVFFTDPQQLTSDAGVEAAGGPGGRALGDLYECEMVREAGGLKCSLRDLTPAVEGRAAAVQGDLLGASEDGSYLYFIASGALSDSANARGETAIAGANNLYVLHYDSGAGRWDAPKLIGALSEDDNIEWESGSTTDPKRIQTTRAAPDGRYLAFMSDRSLTGYDNRDASSGVPDEEVYLYDAAGARLVCASCDPTGARPVGVEFGAKATIGRPRLTEEEDWPEKAWVAAQTPMWSEDGAHQPRFVSDAGRVFFDSSDALVPQDINHNQDVYEYEPAEVGSCSASSATFSGVSGGCVDLISSGAAPGESAFLDASQNGDEVFFLAEKLVSEDPDTSLDVYDAHVCTTASPCFVAPEAAPACTTADACRAAPEAQPSIFGAPSSATFSGAGNVSASKAPVAQPRRLTRAQKRAAALRACRARRRHARRVACERRVRRRFAGRAPRKPDNASKRGGGR